MSRTFNSSSTAEQVIDANHPESMEGRIVIVTGCSSGIGVDTAKQFYRKGATVIMACRSNDKMIKTRNEIIEQVPNSSGVLDMIRLDLGSLSSVELFSTEFAAKYDKLHTLILNAGIMATPFGKTEDGFELQIGTNHLGHFALTMRLIHLMDKVEDPRIVSLSSSMQVLGPMNLKLDDLNWEKRKYSKVGAYSASKLCNVMFASELARKLETTGHGHIRTFSADPGMILTGLQNDRFSQLSMRTLLRPWLKNIPQGASTTMNCATGTNWTESGKFYAHCQTKQPVRIAYDKDAGNKLWAWSEKRTNTIFPFNKE